MKKWLFWIIGLLPGKGFCQARILFNGADIRISQQGKLIVDNPAPDALTILSSGGIISEAAENTLIWNLGNTSASYSVPFISGTQPVPLEFTTSGAAGNGHMTFSTYAGPDWQNSLYLPPGVTNIDREGSDNSIRTVDRFWQINPSGYTHLPSLTNLRFTYKENEWNETGNSISEANLAAQNYNSSTDEWMAPLGIDDPVNNQVNIASVGAANVYPWWTLSSNDYALPLTLLDFSVEKENTGAFLQWLVTAEINVSFYEVQRSLNAVSFTAISRVPASISPGSSVSYQYMDTSTLTDKGTIYYRLRMVDKDGRYSYSPVKFISYTDNSSLQVFPNPVLAVLIVRFGLQQSGRYDISFVNAEGRQVEKHTINVTPNSTFYFPRSAGMASGTYILQVTSGKAKQAFTLLYP